MYNEQQKIKRMGKKLDQLAAALEEAEWESKEAGELLAAWKATQAEFERLIEINLPDDFPTVGSE